ncbi:MAG: hypothetical protein QM765_31595 [Myxococcales bacterium]
MRKILLTLLAGSLVGGCNCAPVDEGDDAAVAVGDASMAEPDGAVQALDAGTVAGLDAQFGRDGGPTGPFRGSIELAQACTRDDSCSYLMTASFMESAQWPLPGCESKAVAGCEVMDCAASAFDHLPPSLSAGTLTVSGLIPGAINLSPAADGYQESGVMRVWEPGAVLSVSATGEVVPAFGGRTITAPADIVVTEPLWRAGSFGSISRSAPLTVAWAGQAPVGVSLTSMTSERILTLRCRLTESPGTVPAEALSNLWAPDAGGVNALSIRPRQVVQFTVQDWEIELSAMGSGGGNAGAFSVSD